MCFTDYDETIQNKLVAFKKESITNTFGEFWQLTKTQVRIAETEICSCDLLLQRRRGRTQRG
ncbi:MAG: hypothetical protein ACLR0U_08830 [Enterocloster clostridioformis]